MHIAAGLSSVLCAAAPLFTALLAWLWLSERLQASRWTGLALGFLGVFGLAWSRARLGFALDDPQQALAIAACLLATLLYGLSVNATRRYLAGVSPIATAAGSQISAALALAPASLWMWPNAMPSPTAWVSALALAVVCSGVAYLLYFRLIADVGPTRAITVTFLIPVFGLGWGALFLGEVASPQMLAGCTVILAGTAFATGLVSWRARSAQRPVQA